MLLSLTTMHTPAKRALAAREFALRVEALERLVASEPVDPRL
jgi:hypothetical protein